METRKSSGICTAAAAARTDSTSAFTNLPGRIFNRSKLNSILFCVQKLEITERERSASNQSRHPFAAFSAQPTGQLTEIFFPTCLCHSGLTEERKSVKQNVVPDPSARRITTNFLMGQFDSRIQFSNPVIIPIFGFARKISARTSPVKFSEVDTLQIKCRHTPPARWEYDASFFSGSIFPPWPIGYRWRRNQPSCRKICLIPPPEADWLIIKSNAGH